MPPSFPRPGSLHSCSVSGAQRPASRAGARIIGTDGSLLDPTPPLAGGDLPEHGDPPARDAGGTGGCAGDHGPGGRRPGWVRARPRAVRGAARGRDRHHRAQRHEGLGHHPRDPHEGGRPPRLGRGGTRRGAPRQPVDFRGDPGARRARGRRRGAPRLHLQGDAVLVPHPLLRVHRGERLLVGRGPLGREPHRPGLVRLRPRLLRRPRAAVEPDLLALDPGQPRVLRLLRRTLHAAGHAARLRGDELRVHARGRHVGRRPRLGPRPSSRTSR